MTSKEDEILFQIQQLQEQLSRMRESEAHDEARPARGLDGTLSSGTLLEQSSPLVNAGNFPSMPAMQGSAASPRDRAAQRLLDSRGGAVSRMNSAGESVPSLAPLSASRMIIVSSHLPVQVGRDSHGGLQVQRTANPAAASSAIASVLDQQWFAQRACVFIGWIGHRPPVVAGTSSSETLDFDRSEQDTCRKLTLEWSSNLSQREESVFGVSSKTVHSGDNESSFDRMRRESAHRLFPVFLEENLVEFALRRFSDGLLWPLFHYIPPAVGADCGASSAASRGLDVRAWHAYVALNHKYAEAVMQVYQHGDIVLVDGLELMLLPSLIRKRVRDVTLGYYLGTPFPSSEYFRILPMRTELLEGVLAADMVGFHAHDYTRHFRSSCTRLLGLDTSYLGISAECSATTKRPHFTRLGTYPMGIDAEQVQRYLASPQMQELIADRRERFGNKRVMIAVDRLDEVKGVPHKLFAFEEFLRRYPQWKHTVVFVLVAVANTGVRAPEAAEQDLLRAKVHELVGRINGVYGTVDHTPIVFITQSLPFEELLALYSCADVALVTSLRESMSKVSYEYVITQRDNHGVLILSEFAGSAQILSHAIRVNPWNTFELADAIDDALIFPEAQRERHHSKMYRYVTTHTAEYWAKSLISRLSELDAVLATERDTLYRGGLRGEAAASILSLSELRPFLLNSKPWRRVVVLDYEGVLCAPQALPELAWPSDELTEQIGVIAMDPRIALFVFSSRAAYVLDAWFPNKRIGLVAESGCEVRMPGVSKWESLVPLSTAADTSWRESVLPILRYFSERTPGAYLETKPHVFSWHYIDADPQFGSWQAKELRADLGDAGCDSLPVEVVTGHKRVEIRPSGVSKVSALRRICGMLPPPAVSHIFALCGAEKQDEDLYSYMRKISASDKGGLLGHTAPRRAVSAAITPPMSQLMTPTMTPAASVASLVSMSTSASSTNEVHAISCRVSSQPASATSSATRHLPSIDSATQLVREIAAMFAANTSSLPPTAQSTKS
uniref:Alpha,alpha-trehalose-phosphate synthase (UDP-forming) n=1 Tax=Erythrolobus australicus TaxID=1077150 RepID=A0A7S1XJL0_9RHOD|mmetsp:Transcript_4971/g.13381  ORF Transcript_4971/g.13381 Transcript_4971/m.13381 type:complete len:1012 (+) Transcript_4971:72-3107(+)